MVQVNFLKRVEQRQELVLAFLPPLVVLKALKLSSHWYGMGLRCPYGAQNCAKIVID